MGAFSFMSHFMKRRLRSHFPSFHKGSRKSLYRVLLLTRIVLFMRTVKEFVVFLLYERYTAFIQRSVNDNTVAYPLVSWITFLLDILLSLGAVFAVKF